MSALFVGRSTYDLGYVCESFPAEDSKISAHAFFAMGGGPALNAAVTFSALGGQARLWTAIGEGAFAAAVRKDLVRYGVGVVDASSGNDDALPVSSIVVNSSSGSRTIINQEPDPKAAVPSRKDWEELARPSIVLSDGHLPVLAEPLLRWAREAGAVTVLDGGSWKPWTHRLLPHVDIAIVSSRFLPPAASSETSRITALERCGVARVAITRGAESILWSDEGREGSLSPPAVDAVDTLGAGDIFHGAFCRFFDESRDFVDSLRRSAEIAASSCTYWGTRAWIAGHKR